MSSSSDKDKSVSSDDEDEDLNNVKQFNIHGLKDRITQNIIKRKHKRGIKRQCGHYKIGLHSDLHPSDLRYYSGKHYDINNVKQLDKGNRISTLEAINELQHEEHLRRIKEEKETQQEAAVVLNPILSDFKKAIVLGEYMEERRISNETNFQEEHKDDTQRQLMEVVHSYKIATDIETERERQESVVRALGGAAEGLGGQEGGLLEDVKALAEHSTKWNVIQEEIDTAGRQLEEDIDDLEHVQTGRLQDLKDQVTEQLTRIIAMINLHQSEAETKREQVADLSKISADGEISDDKKRAVFKLHENAHNELIRAFAGVLAHDGEDEERSTEETKSRKTMAESQLIQRLTAKQLSLECAEEKIRRIRDEGVRLSDPALKQVRDLMFTIEKELIVGRFHGHEESAPYPRFRRETEQDASHRKSREAYRRRTSFVADDCEISIRSDVCMQALHEQHIE